MHSRYTHRSSALPGGPLEVFHPISDHRRLLDAPRGRVTKPLVSPLTPVPPYKERGIHRHRHRWTQTYTDVDPTTTTILKLAQILSSTRLCYSYPDNLSLGNRLCIKIFAILPPCTYISVNNSQECTHVCLHKGHVHHTRCHTTLWLSKSE